MMRNFTVNICFVPAVLFQATALAAEPAELVVLPINVELRGPADSHEVLVVYKTGDQFVGQATDVEITTDNADVVRVVGRCLLPVANGKTTIHVRAGERTAMAKVKVTGLDSPHAYSFRHDVLPVLTKVGCNSGACHGALAGKGGFRLSLRGYDPAGDYRHITREARGRRIELADPGRSLFLAKPSGALAHKGGVRFDVDSQEYKILSGWLTQGIAPPRDDDARVERIEVLPAQSVLKVGDQHDLLVLAHYSDGRVRDVTRWTKCSATDESVAGVDDKSARVTVMGHGEGAVVAQFASKIALARVTVPYENNVPADIFASAKRTNFIDDLVLAQLKILDLPPSPPCSDEDFIRRAFIDTIGRLPTADEAKKFLANRSPEKRDVLIEELLQRPEFVDYWAYKWSDVLLVSGKRLRPQAVKSYYMWIRGQVEKNTPWDVVAQQIVTAKGSSYDNGATNFYALHQTPEDMCENVSQAFLGLSIGCAKCHNHPLEKWTNDQFYGLSNMFARVRAKGWGGDPRNGDGQRTLYVANSGDLVQPRTGRPQPPAPLDGEPLPLDDPGDRREVLAQWLTSPDNPYFSRAIANRVWANFLGVGIVEQVDDLRLSNPASNQPLLAALANYLVEHKYDLKSLMREILRSQTYQRSSEPVAGNAAEKRYYSRYYPRRLMAEVALDAICQVTAVPTKFTHIENIDGSTNKTDFYAEGTRAVQLYDSAVVSQFLSTFGRNERAITCECERSDEPTIVQVLQISNGDVLNEKLASEKSVVAEHVKQSHDDAAIVEAAYLSALSRFPTEGEKVELLKILKETPANERRLALEDLYWGILSSREFLFQH